MERERGKVEERDRETDTPSRVGAAALPASARASVGASELKRERERVRERDRKMDYPAALPASAKVSETV